MSPDLIWGYKPDGIMVERGDLLRWKDEPSKAYGVSTICQDGLKLDYWSGMDVYPYRVLANDCEYSKDGGKTWFACNKLMTKSDVEVEVTVMSKQLSVHQNQAKPSMPLVLLRWLCAPLFALAMLILSIPGALVYLLEPTVRKVTR